MSIINLTSTQLRKAADLQDKIASLQKELLALTGNGATTTATKPAKKKKGMSAAGKARIVAAQKARWAKLKAAKGKTIAEKVILAVKSAPKAAKRTISPEHIAKIKAAQKLRWAKFHAAKAKTTAKSVVKKIVVVAAPKAKQKK